MPKSVTLIKLGGSTITDKSIPNAVRHETLRRLLSEIQRAYQENPGYLVIGHGSGSFAHVPATRYRTAEGFVGPQSRLGMAITQDSAAQLNRIVVKEMLKLDLPAVSLYASNSLVTKKGQAESYFVDVFKEYLRNDLIPVISGDVIVDSEQGCCIWSADTILPFFALEFKKHNWHVNKLIHVTRTPGVYRDINNPDAGIFEHITPDNATEVQAAMGEVKGFDVTGGMWTKISESLELAKAGVDSVILSGEKPGALYDALTGKAEGTTISA
ncbi:isopentenyl phosphate kinase family protein [Candidatus Woesebacteria bacterium]|nr:isopentenyl phosphate kinase family protein [Candidatus Woesebacteria bacterium]MCD8507683.1 isopentenyl phosphate kinase family protein [Candidatus Woesebacteria bacterium]MCD8526734.1 isopentenyl phosphate kinase family protein [Candidatus Woesebacteria bacterium]MCD8546523.1 isopentenyl phosphate kinase family protein [Candidatus Woesebacteria bacterium]